MMPQWLPVPMLLPALMLLPAPMLLPAEEPVLLSPEFRRRSTKH
jgi:hypothetical protein